MHMQTEVVSSRLNMSAFVQKLITASFVYFIINYSFEDCEIHIGGGLIFTSVLKKENMSNFLTAKMDFQCLCFWLEVS